MFTIEFEEPSRKKCDCCDKVNTNLTRFVYHNGDAFAVYYLQFTEGHPRKIVTGIISIGDWGTDDEPKNRNAFPFKIWNEGSHFQVRIIDKEDSPWQHDLLGNILNRIDSLGHPWLEDVFQITDHIVTEDKIIIEYLKN
jgi:hypothetical protein